MDFVDLALLSHDELVESVVLLQTAYQTSQKELAAAKKAGTKAGGGVLQPIQASSGPESWTEEQVAAKAVQVREVAFEVRLLSLPVDVFLSAYFTSLETVADASETITQAIKSAKK